MRQCRPSVSISSAAPSAAARRHASRTTTSIHFLGTGERFSGAGRPDTEEIFRRDLPARLAKAANASRYVGQPVYVEVVGDDPGAFTIDFARPDLAPVAGDTGAPFAPAHP
jgi:hypothetical protein